MNTQPNPQPNPAPAWTPGPWRIVHEQHGCLYIGNAELEMPVAMTSRGIGHGNESESTVEADARLIAAAPEMAEALAASLGAMMALMDETSDMPDTEGGRECFQAIGQARAILARLHGEGGGV